MVKRLAAVLLASIASLSLLGPSAAADGEDPPPPPPPPPGTDSHPPRCC